MSSARRSGRQPTFPLSIRWGLVAFGLLAACTGEQIILGGDPGPPPFDPCAGSSCGVPCDPCDPRSDGGCPPPPPSAACDVHGACVSGGAASCPPYQPCGGKHCNDACHACDPDDPMCIEPPGPSACDPMGTCIAGPVMCP